MNTTSEMASSLSTHKTEAENSQNLKLVILASSVGTLIEWYDLFLAIIMATTISVNLFPHDKDGSKFLETLAVVVSSFLIRPIGSLIFGNIGDKVGRKYSFLVSLLLMGGATFLVGCIPTFESIGWGAPILLLACRIFQGLAISGEYAGATIYVAENAPKNKRGHYTGFIQATVPLGLFICLIVVFTTQSFMSTEKFTQFGWRIPFLFSAVLVILSYAIRRKLNESPLFAQLKKEGKTSKAPIADSFKEPGNVKTMLKAIFGGNAAQSTIMQTSLFVTFYFLQRAAQLEMKTVLFITLIVTALTMYFYQYFGRLSDKIGRKKVMLPGLIASAIMIPVAFYFFLKIGNPEHLKVPHAISGAATVKLIGVSFLLSLAGAATYGPLGAFMLEIFPTKIRYTSMGFAHNIGNGLIGGVTTFATELIKSLVVVSVAFAPFVGLIYPMVIVIVAIIVNGLFIKESYKNDL